MRSDLVGKEKPGKHFLVCGYAFSGLSSYSLLLRCKLFLVEPSPSLYAVAANLYGPLPIYYALQKVLLSGFDLTS